MEAVHTALKGCFPPTRLNLPLSLNYLILMKKLTRLFFVSGHNRLSLLTEELKEHILDSLKFVYSDKEPNIRDKAAKLKNKLLSLGS